MDFKDKVVVVTGAGSGIGESCVKRLLDTNVKVAGFDIRSGKITNENYKHYIVDVRDEKSIKAAIDGVDSQDIMAKT